MIQIKNLSDTPMSEITEIFNNAFADYIMKFTASEVYLQNRWKGAGVDLNLSFGAFTKIDDKLKLVGFIIHGIEGNTAFNVGTGVIPEFRGKRVVKKMYLKAFADLINHGISRFELEVIQSNEVAIKAYKSVGFVLDRELLCYTYEGRKKSLDGTDNNIRVEVDITKLDWKTLQTYWDFTPSWENQTSALLRNPSQYHFVGIYQKEELKGYAIIIPNIGYISQFAIKKEDRRKRLGDQLFNYLSTIAGRLTVINVESSSKGTVKFLTKFGFKEFISQYEMTNSRKK